MPLAEAWLEFAPAAEAAVFEQKSGFFQTFSQQAEANPNIGFVVATRAALGAAQDRNNLILQLRNSLLDRLVNSELVALGIRYRPTRGHYPVKIDPDDFRHGKVHWERSTVDWAGKLYADIKVYDPHVGDTCDEQSSRGSIDSIDRAIRELNAANPNFGKLPKQKAHEQIWEKLGQTYEKGNGLSPQNLSRRIVAICGKRAVSKK